MSEENKAPAPSLKTPDTDPATPGLKVEAPKGRKVEKSEKEDAKMSAVQAALRDTDVLAAEQLDHLRTVAAASGEAVVDGVEEAELRKIAEARAEELKSMAIRPEGTPYVNAPSNWDVVAVTEDTIRATNRLSGEVYEGTAKDFLKK